MGQDNVPEKFTITIIQVVISVSAYEGRRCLRAHMGIEISEDVKKAPAWDSGNGAGQASVKFLTRE